MSETGLGERRVSRAGVLRRSELTRLSSGSDDEVGGSKRDARAETASRGEAWVCCEAADPYGGSGTGESIR
jgi:hypothetical protein